MDLAGIPKRAWRARPVEAYRTYIRQALPADQAFFTLGGPCTAPDSELAYLTKERGLIEPYQYVSVERDKTIHEANCRITGPTWIRGDFGRMLECWMDGGHSLVGRSGSTGRWHKLNSFGVASYDAMCGIREAFPTIDRIFNAADFQCGEWEMCEKDTLIVINVMKTNRWRVNQGGTFEEPLPTFNRWISAFHKPWKRRLIDYHEYRNKTVGTGSGISVLSTFMFLR